MWAFKSLWDRGLIYEGFRVLAYCWRCETPLSNTETRMDDVYQDRQDPALTVGFELLDDRRAAAIGCWPGRRRRGRCRPTWPLAVAPTSTTPCRTRRRGATSWPNRASRPTSAELGAAQPRRPRSSGADLVGRRYRPLFDFFADPPCTTRARHSRCSAADFVSTEEGTGIVHLAPGFGEDDQIAANAVGIPTIVPMDEHGQYTAAVAPWAGMHVFDANPHVIRELKERGVVLRHETYDHPYPHCWRCSQPLVYRAISSWFVEVTKFRDRMVELNEEITLGARARQARQLRQVAGERPGLVDQPQPVLGIADPGVAQRRPGPSARRRVWLDRRPRGRLRRHRRPISTARWSTSWCGRTRTTRPGRSMMRRVPEVLDCWFESGSMPFAQVHYPFENAGVVRGPLPG